MRLISHNFQDGQAIPGEFAFAVPDATAHIALSSNRNPHLAWSDIPEGTQSFVIICHDPDVPSKGDDVNQEGREVPAELPRIDFFHWLLLDIPASIKQIEAGSHSNGVTPRGKPGPNAADGLRHGTNDYTVWFAGDAQMKGEYYGYDGPCPPWNDTLVHRYIFTVYALATPALAVDAPLTGVSVRAALATAPVLGQASLTGLYRLNLSVPLD
ncbi:phospholipid-binding protein [Pseudomonas aeruginosa]|uniref:YbhB/YbcL family Raf kinase inhibitor-like protein n=2 Tax=Pseudomonadota TaxID=1224 RepID=A0ABS0VCR8_PSEVE|nr:MULTISPECIES: YbhB/YbcL family Raf kinase inhibitor-like protein [Gammaproteobacteria]KSG99745.1 phospholipid-binding protein [Pseudomonas aeruginosa]KSL77429.1 phospholipid-binding protein [Pseudomonas aeruginosa]KSM91880.1 phospholipid-binding protein [Pseudomonas aeruginosa]MBI6551908.1 YbhB/YbcL family Raf kinase inhibitor-like protein [Pseudomonas veronii]MBI6649292.1 YbhB/YbcL family Raf kinase inhibitor-like protein [Pseudomonas veronii]